MVEWELSALAGGLRCYPPSVGPTGWSRSEDFEGSLSCTIKVYNI